MLHAYAECRECLWTSVRRNALALAAQHHDRTGHKVSAEQTIGVIYGDLSEKPGEPTPEIPGQLTLV